MQRRSYAEAHTIRYSQKCLKLDLAETVRLYFEEQLTLAEVGKRVGAAGITVSKRLVAAGYRRSETEVSRGILKNHGVPSSRMPTLQRWNDSIAKRSGRLRKSRIGMSAVI